MGIAEKDNNLDKLRELSVKLEDISDEEIKEISNSEKFKNQIIDELERYKSTKNIKSREKE